MFESAGIQSLQEVLFVHKSLNGKAPLLQVARAESVPIRRPVERFKAKGTRE
jgi:hypothetical protein